jgi:signal transduction histidine kinase/CheY-like chemotaxis protein/HPt (histidine-containing phosphotransfer) domain-containing protein
MLYGRDTFNFLAFIGMRLFVLCLVLTCLVPQISHAQMLETSSRVELVDEIDSFDITSHVHITQIVDQQLNYKAIVERYKNGRRGQKQDGDFVDLGHQGHAAWLVFSVTNTSNSDQWVLDLGGSFGGRFGFVETLFVRNDTTRQTFMRFDGDEDKFLNSQKYMNGQIPVILPKNQTSMIVVAVKMQSGQSAMLQPKLLSYDEAQTQVTQNSFVKNALVVFFVFMAGIFVSLSYVRSNPTYFWFSLYYCVQAFVVLILDQGMLPTFWASVFSLNILIFSGLALSVLINSEFLKLNNDDDGLWKRISAGLAVLFIVLAAVSSFIVPGQPSFFVILIYYVLPAIGALLLSFMAYKKARYGYYGAYALSLSWFVFALGFFVSGLAMMKILSVQGLLMYGYWIALVPQAALFVFASVSKIKNLMAEERQGYIKRSDDAVSQAKDIQSREAEDQAKLLRVIERERELMAGLRELEVHRAEEMRIAKEEADEANRAKSAFLAVVSHEVRTPMTGILGMVRLLLDSKLSEKQHEYVMAVQNSGESMMALLNDILDFEKIETGNLDLEHIDFNVHQLVNGVVTLMSGHAAEKGVELRSDIDPQAPRFVNGDPTRLRQVILNFVNNAIKFTEQGTVTVKVKCDVMQDSDAPAGGNNVSIYFGIEDTGIGISEEAQKTLFDPFSQADSSVTRKYGGTGLGLTICQKLIEAMGSVIDLKSVPDQGSVFSFTLAMELGEEADTVDVSKPQPSVYDHQDSQPLTILIVEDNDMNQKVLQGFLQPFGHRLVMFDNAEDAIELCKAVYGVEGVELDANLKSLIPDNFSAFDCVLMDMQLPGISGLEATRVIRSYDVDSLNALPIIALTGNVLMDDVKSYYQSGMNGFLAKPIDYEALKETLGKVKDGTLRAPEMDQESVEPPVVDNVIETFDVVEKEEGPPLEFDDGMAPILSQAVHLAPQEPAKQSDASLLDMLMLDSLSSNLGKDQCVELMAGFMEKNEELVGVLQTLPQDDFESLNAKGHELKGMAANFGLKALSDVAGIIEDGSKAEDAQMIAAGVSKIQAVYNDSKAALDEWLGQL